MAKRIPTRSDFPETICSPRIDRTLGGNDAEITDRQPWVSSEKPRLQCRENAVTRFEHIDFRREERSLLQCLGDPAEPLQMLFRAPMGIRNQGSRFHDEGPVARLGEQELPPRLPERPSPQRIAAIPFVRE